MFDVLANSSLREEMVYTWSWIRYNIKRGQALAFAVIQLFTVKTRSFLLISHKMSGMFKQINHNNNNNKIVRHVGDVSSKCYEKPFHQPNMSWL